MQITAYQAGSFMAVVGNFCWKDKSVCAYKYGCWSVCGDQTKDRRMVKSLEHERVLERAAGNCNPLL